MCNKFNFIEFLSHEKKISQISESLARKWNTLERNRLTMVTTWLKQRENITLNPASKGALTVFRSIMRKFTVSALWKGFERGLHYVRTHSPLMLHQIFAGRIYIYLHLVHRSGGVIPIFCDSVHRASRTLPLMLTTFAKGLALTGIGTPLELDPFSESNYFTFPSKGS